MYILGIGGFSHDSAACLVDDGRLVAAAMEERFTRRKHEGGIPRKAVEYCLSEAGITLDDVDHVGVYMDPGVRLRRRIPYRIRQFPKSPKFSMAYLMYEFYHNAEFILGSRSLRGAKAQLHFLDHHLMHAASAFLVSPFESAAFLTIDYIGEWTATLWGVGEGSELTKLGEIAYPHSLGVVYSAVTDYLGFLRANDEYKVMGLAAYGEPVYYDDFRRMVKLLPGGRYRIDLSNFIYHYAPGSQLGYMSDAFKKRYGPKRRKGDPIEKRHMDIASSVQKVLEDTVLHMCAHLHEETGESRLCIAGGVGLNSVMNGRLLREGPFREIYVQPAAGDDGIAIGAAFYLYNTVLGNPRGFVMDHAYWGPEYSDGEIRDYLELCKLPYEELDSPERKAAELIADGEIVGWFQGRMEFGPRALGARSILADPRRADMKDILNKYVKHREEFRPFAPAVLEQEAGRYFDGCHRSPFMLFVHDVIPDRREQVPSITHVDGTGRVQTVDSKANPRYRAMIEDFKALTGVPVVINTSFNIRGEPIVCSPADAVRCFFGTGMDSLVMGRFLLRKQWPSA